MGLMRPEELALLTVGRELGIKSLETGVFHKELFESARGHAEYMARIGVQGHQNFDKRFRELSKIIPGREVIEIVCETWSWNMELIPAAKDCYKSWKGSSGHWAVCNGVCAYFGISMARGRLKRTGKDVWFGCELVAR